jgi:tetratricopeptide (TPR) repeat protein
MIATFLLTLLMVLLLAGLGWAAWRLRRRQRALHDRREALRKQRGAAHIREIALSAQAHTGRADIAVMLLQLSIELLEEALRLAPDEQTIGESLAQLHQLIDSMQLDDRPSTPVPHPESLAALTTASMQITEAIRLLVRLESRGDMDRGELQAMQTELRHVQRTIDTRARVRQELQAPSVLLSAVDLPPQLESTGNTRIGPLN